MQITGHSSPSAQRGYQKNVQNQPWMSDVMHTAASNISTSHNSKYAVDIIVKGIVWVWNVRYVFKIFGVLRCH